MRRATLLLALSLLPTLTSSGQTPSFRAGIELVEVTAVVRDRDRPLVRDLTPSDFQILERGVHKDWPRSTACRFR